MSLQLDRLHGPLVRYEWSAANSGAAATGGVNQFLFVYGSQSTPILVETNGQRRAGLAFKLWRLAAGFCAGAPTSQATVTARINGVSQATTATVIGTALGVIITDLSAAIAIAPADNLSTLFVTTTTDTGSTEPRALLVGVANDSI